MLKLDPNKTALLVINMNNDLLAWDGVAPLIPGLRQLLQAARARGVSVVYSRLAFAPGGADSGATGKFWEAIGSGGVLTKGTEGAEVCRELEPLPGDTVLIRNRYSAFFNTELDELLRKRGIENLIICGYSTNFCCDSTARDAHFRDYNTVVLRDGTAPIALNDEQGNPISAEEVQKTVLANLSRGIAQVASIAEVVEALRP